MELVRNDGLKTGQKRVLKGDRNQCGGCGEYFRSTYAFDKHRVGNFGVDRRCLTVPEMLDRGMALNRAGFWVSEAFGNAVSRRGDVRFSASRHLGATLTHPATSIASTHAA